LHFGGFAVGDTNLAGVAVVFGVAGDDAVEADAGASPQFPDH